MYVPKGYEPIKISGSLKLSCFRASEVPDASTYRELRSQGEVEGWETYSDSIHNIVVTSGFRRLNDSMISSTGVNLDYIGVGSSSTTPALSDTALGTQITRVQADDRFRVGNTSCVISAFFSSSTGNGSWNESGTFNAASGGDMFSHALFSSTWTKTSSDVAVVEWTYSFSQ